MSQRGLSALRLLQGNGRELMLASDVDLRRAWNGSIAISLVLASFMLSPAASAADVRIGDTPLRLPQPSGYCELDPVLGSDAPLIGRIHSAIAKTGNRLLIMSAECSELRDWRAGNRQDIDHIAEYQTILEFENQSLPDKPAKLIQTYCNNMNAFGDQAMPGTERDVGKRAEQAAKVIKVSEMMFLGVAAQDSLVCYAASLQKFKVGSQEVSTQVTIMATTIVKDRIVAYYLFAPYGGKDSVAQLLTKQRANVGQLQRLNHD
jgi:hypothetical protein